MKNTIENKARFFALYWGQIVYKENKNDLGLQGVSWKKLRLGSHDLNNGLLELKPLSQITDKEAISAIMISLHEPKNNFKGEVIEAIKYYKTATSFEYAEADYLRGNGYALDYTTPEGETITVSEMIEFGWIKIKE